MPIHSLERLSLFGSAPFSSEAHAFQDILGQQLALDTGRLIARGLHREYRAHEAELSSPRGRILFGGLARSMSSARATVACRYFERTDDHALNVTLLAGLIFAARLVTNPELSGELKRLAALIDVGPRPLTRELLVSARAQIDRRSRHYEPLLDLIEILHDGQGASLQGEQQGLQLSGFLFDMNRFFQALVSRVLSEHLEGWTVFDERRLQPMFHYATTTPRRSAPVLRPDFTIRSPNGRPGPTLDAKYRDLWETPLPAHMLYQLALYAQADPRLEAAIIYPSLQDRPDQQIVMNDPITQNKRASIYLRALNLEQLRRQLADGSSAAQRREISKSASRLAFGKEN